MGRLVRLTDVRAKDCNVSVLCCGEITYSVKSRSRSHAWSMNPTFMDRWHPPMALPPLQIIRWLGDIGCRRPAILDRIDLTRKNILEFMGIPSLTRKPEPSPQGEESDCFRGIPGSKINLPQFAEFYPPGQAEKVIEEIRGSISEES